MNIYTEQAQLLIEKGFSVTPVKNKAARITNWQNIYGEEILSPQHNSYWRSADGIGILCGKPSGIICLDIDLLEDDKSPQKIKVREELLKMLPPIFSGRVGNKKKPPARFYQYNGEKNKKFNNIDVELLSTGNQTLIPPSVHPSGGFYEWAGHSLLEIEVDELPYIDQSILKWLDEMNERLRPNPVKGESNSLELYSIAGRPKKNSHNYLSRIGVKLRVMDEDFNSVVERLLKTDEKINKDEAYFYFNWPEKFKDCMDKTANARLFVQEIFDRNKPDPKYKFFPTLKNGFYIEDPEGKKKPTPDYHSFAEYAEKVIYLKSKETINYVFNGDFYEPIDRLGIEKIIYDIAGNKLSPNHSSHFVKMARARCSYTPEFINPRDKLNLKNGILLKDCMKLVPHDANEFFTYKIEHDYCESTETPVFDRFLDLIATGQESKKQLLMEFIGYCLSGCDYSRFNKILILDGAGANGKTTFINLVQNLVGTNNISGETLESLKDNRFAVSSLVGKLVNFCAEEPKSAFAASGILKKLTGNDSMQAEFKHMKSFSFINYAKFIISYNEMPFLPDTTSGMQRRLIIVPCTTDLEKNPEKKIRNVLDKIKPEYGSIIHKCMLAFRMVEERGAFTEIQDGKDRYKELVRQSDIISDFVETMIKPSGDDSFVATNVLWAQFEDFVGNRHKFTKRGFETKLPKYLLKMKGVTKKDHAVLRGYNGIKFA